MLPFVSTQRSLLPSRRSSLPSKKVRLPSRTRFTMYPSLVTTKSPAISKNFCHFDTLSAPIESNKTQKPSKHGPLLEHFSQGCVLSVPSMTDDVAEPKLSLGFLTHWELILTGSLNVIDATECTCGPTPEKTLRIEEWPRNWEQRDLPKAGWERISAVPAELGAVKETGRHPGLGHCSRR